MRTQKQARKPIRIFRQGLALAIPAKFEDKQNDTSINVPQYTNQSYSIGYSS
jgi:hypothetical protein